MSKALAEVIKPLNQYIDNLDISEIIINNPEEVFLETSSGWLREENQTLTLDFFRRIGQIFSNIKSKSTGFDDHPYIAGELPGGHRIHICMGDTVESKIAIAIRLKRKRNLSVNNFLSKNSFKKAEDLSFDFNKIEDSLKKIVEEKRNILISGATSSGKTNLLNVLLKFVPKTDRFLSIEDVRELDTSHLNNKVHFVVSDSEKRDAISQQDVLNAMMRLRPDRIACGELRGENSWTLLSLLNNGHGGCMTTIHASSGLQAIKKVVTNALSAQGLTIDKNIMEEITRSCLDVVIQLQNSNRERFISEILLRGKDF